MKYYACTPAPPLADYVDCFWTCLDIPFHEPVRVLPRGTFELVFNLKEDEIRVCDSVRPDRHLRYSGAVMSGAYSGSLLIDPMHRSSMIGVHFKPRGAFRFLGVRADELANLHVDLDALWGEQADELRTRLCAAATVGQRLALLEESLISRLQYAPTGHHGVSVTLAMIDQTEGNARMQDVARHVGLSQRRLIQLFAAEVGLTPKLYCRVRRFQRVRDLVRAAEDPDWAQLAVDCGYFDQSHLIHDFQALAGLSPTNYLRQSHAKHGQIFANHIPTQG